jgi:hypothetical protein
MEAICSSETSVATQQTTRRYIPEDDTLLERNRPRERPRPRWKDDLKMGLKEVECDGVDFIHVTQDRDQRRALMNTMVTLPTL